MIDLKSAVTWIGTLAAAIVGALTVWSALGLATEDDLQRLEGEFLDLAIAVYSNDASRQQILLAEMQVKGLSGSQEYVVVFRAAKGLQARVDAAMKRRIALRN